MLDITFSYFFELFEFLIAKWCSSKIRVECISADIILKVIMFRSSDIDGHIFNIVRGMKPFCDGSSILKIYFALQQYLQQFLITVIKFWWLFYSDSINITME